MGCTELVFLDDFEDTSDSWQGGVIDSRSDELSSFLGPFGKGQDSASKVREKAVLVLIISRLFWERLRMFFVSDVSFLLRFVIKDLLRSSRCQSSDD